MASRGAALRCRRKVVGRCWSSCVLLWVGTLASSLLGTLSDPRGRNPENQLDVTRGASVLLSASVPSDQLMSATEWDFAPRAGQRVLLMESSGSSHRIHSEHRFGRRIEVINMTCLRIWDLETGDNGIFMARVKFHGGGVKDYSFTLTVHEPVPTPWVNCSVTSRFPEGCNMTLYCEGTGSGEFKISWAKGEPPQALEEGGSDWYRLSGNGTALQLSWHFGSSLLPITCLVSSAAEERASLGVASCCHSPEAKETRPPLWPWYLLAIMVTTAVLLGSLWIWTERRRRTPRRGWKTRYICYKCKQERLNELESFMVLKRLWPQVKRKAFLSAPEGGPIQ
ncbi:uncharacterized protein LOC134506474 [Candoia aspera]|uniref:uncharacterized protein LOC134506474 n=1 Tax=Candoia aspera TaxID=51853 RepID=UPI002FD836A1